jgi:hypothetical protein
VFAITPEQILARVATGGVFSDVSAMESTWYVKGRKARMDLKIAAAPGTTMPEVYIILDEQAGSASLVLPQTRTYMVVPIAAMQQLQGLIGGGVPVPQQASQGTAQTRTLGSQTVAGVQAEGFEIRVGDSVFARGWSAPQYRGVLPQMFDALGRLTPGDAMGAIADRGMPVRFQALSRVPAGPNGSPAAGHSYVFMDVPSIERRTVADDQLQVPAGFQRAAMPFMAQ